MTNFRRFLFSFAPPLLWMGLIFYLSGIPNLELQGDWASWDFWLRKSAHLFEYGALFVLWQRALGNSKWAALTALLYAVSDELHQHLIPTRDGKVLDVLIDSLGVLATWWLLQRLHLKKGYTLNKV